MRPTWSCDADIERRGPAARAGAQVLGAVARRYRDFDDAEDAVQEALLAGATQWPAEGVPDNPPGWLIAVAARRMTDRLRNEEARRRREYVAALREPADGPPPVPDRDDSLMLLFLCCHPALTPASAIPLTLRACGGLSTAEIARAFLVPEATMAQRISRAKQRIKASGAPSVMPTGGERAERLRSVLHVLYLLFTEGYAASTGARVARSELSVEAIRLMRIVHASLPDDPEVSGLLALTLLNEARRPARTGQSGELVQLYWLGEDMAVRLPRVEWAIGQVEKEQRWLPRLVPLLPLAVPVPLGLGTPAEGGVSHFRVS